MKIQGWKVGREGWWRESPGTYTFVPGYSWVSNRAPTGHVLRWNTSNRCHPLDAVSPHRRQSYPSPWWKFPLAVRRTPLRRSPDWKSTKEKRGKERIGLLLCYLHQVGSLWGCSRTSRCGGGDSLGTRRARTDAALKHFFFPFPSSTEKNVQDLHMRTASYFGFQPSSVLASWASQTNVSTSPTRRPAQTTGMLVPVVSSNSLISSRTDKPLPRPRLYT